MRPSRSSKFTCMVAGRAQQQWGEQDCKDLTKSDLVFPFCWLKWIFYLLSPRLNCWSKKGKPGIEMTIDFSLFQNKQQELLTSCLMKSLHVCWDADVMWTLQDLKLALRNICGNGNTEMKCVQFGESTFFQLCWCECVSVTGENRFLFFFSNYFRINSDFGVPRLYLELCCLFSSSDFSFDFFFPTVCMYDFNTMIQFNWRTDIPCQMLGRIHLMLSALLLHKRRLLNIAQQRRTL